VGRVEYVSATDAQALEAFQLTTRLEGIIPALESSHAIAYAKTVARDLGPNHVMVVSLSGRGDKDIATVAKALGDRAYGEGDLS
jgi:tryptophan synthase beta chain